MSTWRSTRPAANGQRQEHEPLVGGHQRGRGDDRGGHAEFKLVRVGIEAKQHLLDRPVLEAKRRRLQAQDLDWLLGEGTQQNSADIIVVERVVERSDLEVDVVAVLDRVGASTVAELFAVEMRIDDVLDPPGEIRFFGTLITPQGAVFRSSSRAEPWQDRARQRQASPGQV